MVATLNVDILRNKESELAETLCLLKKRWLEPPIYGCPLNNIKVSGAILVVVNSACYFIW